MLTSIVYAFIYIHIMIDVKTINNILICFRLKSTLQAHKRIVTGYAICLFYRLYKQQPVMVLVVPNTFDYTCPVIYTLSRYLTLSPKTGPQTASPFDPHADPSFGGGG